MFSGGVVDLSKRENIVNKCFDEHILIAEGKDLVCLPQRGKVAQPIFILVVTDEVWCKIMPSHRLAAGASPRPTTNLY